MQVKWWKRRRTSTCASRLRICESRSAIIFRAFSREAASSIPASSNTCVSATLVNHNVKTQEHVKTYDRQTFVSTRRAQQRLQPPRLTKTHLNESLTHKYVITTAARTRIFSSASDSRACSSLQRVSSDCAAVRRAANCSSSTATAAARASAAASCDRNRTVSCTHTITLLVDRQSKDTHMCMYWSTDADRRECTSCAASTAACDSGEWTCAGRGSSSASSVSCRGGSGTNATSGDGPAACCCCCNTRAARVYNFLHKLVDETVKSTSRKKFYLVAFEFVLGNGQLCA